MISSEELAAVLAALSAVMQPEETPQESVMPAWRRAMRAESVLPFDE